MALSNALIGANLLAAAGACQLNITANTVHIDHPFMSMPFAPLHMAASIDYTVSKPGLGGVVYKNTLRTPYQHDYEIAIPLYIGTMNTVHDTINGAIAANIAQFVTALSTYKF